MRRVRYDDPGWLAAGWLAADWLATGCWLWLLDTGCWLLAAPNSSDHAQEKGKVSSLGGRRHLI